jgi:NADH-quinone oxidoreductase subunit F
MQRVIDRICSGDGSQADVQLLKNVATQMQGKCLCALGEFSTMSVVSGIERFPQDFERKAVTEPA